MEEWRHTQNAGDEVPFIDEIATTAPAEPEEVWAALTTVILRAFSDGGKEAFLRLLGCRHPRRAVPGRWPPAPPSPGALDGRSAPWSSVRRSIA